MNKEVKPFGYWCKDRCREVAMLCNSRTELANKYPTAYHKSLKKGWLGELCSHMKPLGNWKNRFVYVYEFPDNHAYIGITFNPKNRNSSHMIDGPVFKHTLEKSLPFPEQKIISPLIPVNDAIILEAETINLYRSNGWNILNTNKAGSIGGNIIKWTFEECKKEACTYTSRGSFKSGSSVAYTTAMRKKWLDTICKHMLPSKRNLAGYLTFEKCKELAINCKNRNQLKSNHETAYKASLKNGWLGSFFKD